MTKTLLKYIANSSLALSGASYLYNYLTAFQLKKNEFKKGEILPDHFTDKLVHIVNKSKLSIENKLRLEFKKDSFLKNLDFTSTGSIISFMRTISLPTYFTYENENDLKPLFDYLKKRYSTKFKDIDLNEYKNLFLLEPKEIEFAVLLEIYKTKFDYAITDSILIGILPVGISNFFFTSFEKIKPGFNFGFSLFLTMIGLAIYFSKKNTFLEYLCLKEILKLNDKELLKSGITYLEKKNNQKLLFKDKKSGDIDYMINLIKVKLNEESIDDIK